MTFCESVAGSSCRALLHTWHAVPVLIGGQGSLFVEIPSYITGITIVSVFRLVQLTRMTYKSTFASTTFYMAGILLDLTGFDWI